MNVGEQTANGSDMNWIVVKIISISIFIFRRSDLLNGYEYGSYIKHIRIQIYVFYNSELYNFFHKIY